MKCFNFDQSNLKRKHCILVILWNIEQTINRCTKYFKQITLYVYSSVRVRNSDYLQIPLLKTLIETFDLFLLSYGRK